MIKIRLRHMLDAAREAVHFAEGKTRGDLDRDRLLALGLMKCIEIIGEAAAKPLDGAGNSAHSSLEIHPWHA